MRTFWPVFRKWLSHTTLYEFLEPCQYFTKKKKNNPISRKCQDRWTKGLSNPISQDLIIKSSIEVVSRNEDLGESNCLHFLKLFDWSIF